MCDQQHGFHQGRSCETQLLLTVDDFAENLNRNEQADVIFLQSLIYKISHQYLFNKLHYYGITGNLPTFCAAKVSARSS